MAKKPLPVHAAGKKELFRQNVRAGLGEPEAFWKDFRKGEGFEKVSVVDLGDGLYMRSIPRDPVGDKAWDALDVWNLAVEKSEAGKLRIGSKAIGPVEFAAKTLGIPIKEARDIEYLANELSYQEGRLKKTVSNPAGHLVKRSARRTGMTAKTAKVFVPFRELLSNALRKPLELTAGQEAVVLTRRGGEVDRKDIRNLSGLGTLRQRPDLPKFVGTHDRPGQGQPGDTNRKYRRSRSARQDRASVIGIQVKITKGAPVLHTPSPELTAKVEATVSDLDRLMKEREEHAQQLAEMDRLILEKLKKSGGK